jgi:hypothetical protein
VRASSIPLPGTTVSSDYLTLLSLSNEYTVEACAFLIERKKLEMGQLQEVLKIARTLLALDMANCTVWARLLTAIAHHLISQAPGQSASFFQASAQSPSKGTARRKSSVSTNLRSPMSPSPNAVARSLQGEQHGQSSPSQMPALKLSWDQPFTNLDADLVDIDPPMSSPLLSSQIIAEHDVVPDDRECDGNVDDDDDDDDDWVWASIHVRSCKFISPIDLRVVYLCVCVCVCVSSQDDWDDFEAAPSMGGVLDQVASVYLTFFAEHNWNRASLLQAVEFIPDMSHRGSLRYMSWACSLRGDTRECDCVVVLSVVIFVRARSCSCHHVGPPASSKIQLTSFDGIQFVSSSKMARMVTASGHSGVLTGAFSKCTTTSTTASATSKVVTSSIARSKPVMARQQHNFSTHGWTCFDNSA